MASENNKYIIIRYIIKLLKNTECEQKNVEMTINIF